MNTVILFEDEAYKNLQPLVMWRSVFELRVGRKILLDRTAQRLGLPISGIWTRDRMGIVAGQRCGAPVNQPIVAGTVLVNGRWLVGRDTMFGSAPIVGVVDDQVAYIVCDEELADKLTPIDLQDATLKHRALIGVERVEAGGSLINYPWEVIANLGELLEGDWEPGDASIDSDIDAGVIPEPSDRIHVGQRTVIHRTAIVDASAGPIFISHDVHIGPYAIIEGPVYLGPGTQVNPHAWLHGGNAIGPVCKVGGEICGCVMLGYVNKRHHGFLGHAYVGSWVNLGAGCVNSNLKNTYGKVRVSLNGEKVDTGLQFFGSIIADHAKIGINATLPTGIVIGFAANVSGSQVAPKNVPSFAWVTDSGRSKGDPARLLDASTQMMIRRGVDMTDEEIELFLELGSRE
jgi:UDP-N-acetylglucosamine diphosphorylase/glucosamine-1-phosphate N-acetyltransferase